MGLINHATVSAHEIVIFSARSFETGPSQLLQPLSVRQFVVKAFPGYVRCDWS